MNDDFGQYLHVFLFLSIRSKTSILSFTLFIERRLFEIFILTIGTDSILLVGLDKKIC